MKSVEGHESADVSVRRDKPGAGSPGWSPLLLGSPLGAAILVAAACGVLVVRGFGTTSKDAPGDQVGAPVYTTGAELRTDDAAAVFDDAQRTWDRIFTESGRHHEPAKLVLFTDRTSSACGYGASATGPFYCPGDDRVTIDRGFGGGDLAQAYVIAHEMGHHVQRQLGAAAAVRGLKRSERPGEASTRDRLELQADCYAGIWAGQAHGSLAPGNAEAALSAAASVANARQKQALGPVMPETFTHGTAEQRVRWLKTGMERGDLQACDTLNATNL